MDRGEGGGERSGGNSGNTSSNNGGGGSNRGGGNQGGGGGGRSNSDLKNGRKELRGLGQVNIIVNFMAPRTSKTIVSKNLFLWVFNAIKCLRKQLFCAVIRCLPKK